MSVDLSPTIAGLGFAGMAAGATLAARGSAAATIGFSAVALPAGALAWHAIQRHEGVVDPLQTTLAGMAGLLGAASAVGAVHGAGMSAARTGAFGALVGLGSATSMLAVNRAVLTSAERVEAQRAERTEAAS